MTPASQLEQWELDERVKGRLAGVDTLQPHDILDVENLGAVLTIVATTYGANLVRSLERITTLLPAGTYPRRAKGTLALDEHKALGEVLKREEQRLRDVFFQKQRIHGKTRARSICKHTRAYHDELATLRVKLDTRLGDEHSCKGARYDHEYERALARIYIRHAP